MINEQEKLQNILIDKGIYLSESMDEMEFEGVKTEVHPIMTDTVIDKDNLNTINIGKLPKSDEIIYWAGRNILQNNPNNETFLDLIIYNKSPFPESVNRSKGHRNSPTAIEEFEILYGEVFILCFDTSRKIYAGIYKQGERFNIPSGYYHCTYILSDMAAIINYYYRAAWKADLSLKPYFNEKNMWRVFRKNNNFFINDFKSNIELNEFIDSDHIISCYENEEFSSLFDISLVDTYKYWLKNE